MGAKDSKPSFISYEDAVKRVSDSELRRIREAFKRCAGVNETVLSLEAFVHEVLCDGVPYEVAEWLYQGCGGTKRGIAFKELLCGIVVLTKGNIEEKIKFLWTLYTNNQGDNGTYIYKRDFARTLHLENTSLPVTGAQRSAEILLGLFGQGDKVTFDQFRSWLLIHKDATVLSKWLLSDLNITNDLETPTFYQSLAGVTHLEERDIIELEKCFWSLRHSAPTGELDIESLTPLLSPPLPPAAVAGTFLAFDENRDGHVDFKELCCGLSAACRGPRTERLKFCFKIFDLDSDGVLNQKELADMVDILCTVANEHVRIQGSRASTPDEAEPEVEKGFDPEVILANLREKLVVAPKGKKPVFQLGSSAEEMIVLNESETESATEASTVLTLEDFLIWSVESADALVSPFLALLFSTCHIVLGLRPQCKHHERNIVLGWLHRWTSGGYRVGQFWYLIDAEWWRAWAQYTRHPEPCGAACALPRHRHDHEPPTPCACDDSLTTHSTESMGSLVWRGDSASLGSAGSSSGIGSAARDPPPAPRPGHIDNSRLRARDTLQVRSLTGEGGHVRRDIPLVQHRDFELVPDALWRALAHWYSAPDPLPRQVIRPPNSDVELELYPLQLLLYRHVPSTQRAGAVGGAGAGAGVGGGCAAAYSAVPAPPERQLAYTAAFSRLATVKQVIEFLCAVLGLAREDVRLWALGGSAVLLDDERPTLAELQLHDRSRVLLELRNADLTWPEEIGALSLSGGGSRATERRETLAAPNLPGATGLHNLGNTCYMNAALQSVWNTGPLTRYFNSGMHLYEVNTENPLGTRGTLALRYGELCKEVWSNRARSVAPLRVRWCVSRWARALAGGGQHDAQELLAWLLDALHEDLNRARPPPRAPAPPPAAPPADALPAARPDQEVAAEAWAAHTARNDSIMTDLFCGQLKSRVKCEVCGTESVRFDAFNMLSLPLPMESYVRVQIRVILLDGSVPVKYGVRVNSEGTYMDLKKNLSELCGLPSESMILVELNGAVLGRVLEEGGRVAAPPAELCAYQLPPRAPAPPLLHNGWGPGESEDAGVGGGVDGGGGGGAGAQWRAEVSVGGGNTASLCMPALFCFKRSRSEAVMSHSPPTAFLRSHSTYTDSADYRSNTLPKDAKKDVTASPTLSVKSLNMKTSSPKLGRAKFSSSPSNMCNLEQRPPNRIHYLVAVHRKQCRADAYFLPSQRSRPALFGVPLLVGVRPGMSGREVYGAVWTQVARLLSARPPPADTCNHATDCDDSLGYEFPFTLRVVSRGGAWCAVCPWTDMCRGCALPTDTAPLVRLAPDEAGPGRQSSCASARLVDDGPAGAGSPAARAKLQRQASARAAHHHQETCESGTLKALELSALGGGSRHGMARAAMLAIEWDPTALHLRYQSTRERQAKHHASVAREAAEASKAIDLQSCLGAFTLAERLEERYHCSACKENQPATKTLQLWRAPPILIIHLKRFQYVNNKWIKSQKVVNFPFQDFDPTEYLASVPRETILRHRELAPARRPSGLGEPITESDSDDDADADDKEPNETKNRAPSERKRRGSLEARRRERLQSTSLQTTPVTDDNLVDYHRHHLLPDHHPFHLQYRLYAVVCHSGQLSGGHYVAYARNPSGAWLCYNDSSCREVNPQPRQHPPIDPAAAYLLFYERQGLDYEKYLPDIRGRAPVLSDADALDPDDSDLKKMCVVC